MDEYFIIKMQSIKQINLQYFLIKNDIFLQKATRINEAFNLKIGLNRLLINSAFA